jgi:hypothetical protein
MKLYPIIGLLIASPALANNFDETCSRSSYFLNQPRILEDSELTRTRKLCNTFSNNHWYLSNFFQESDIEKQLNLETSIAVKDFRASIFIDYQNPTRNFNTGFLVSHEFANNFSLDLGMLQPLNETEPRQLLIGLEFKF